MRSCSGFSGQAKQLAISFMTRISLHWLPSMGSANSGPPIATSRGFLEFVFEIRSISKADRRGSLAFFGCISLHSYVADYPSAISPGLKQPEAIRFDSFDSKEFTPIPPTLKALREKIQQDER